ncbi:MAG TPA: chorismate-binding protein, partial [Kofleriaceae bacterium]|nr:chorismate-binding protein [Kofleriaceae bacterium]
MASDPPPGQPPGQPLGQPLGPLEAAARLAGLRGRVLLHSARDDDGLGRASFVAAEPHATLIARGRSLVRLDAQGRPVQRFTGDPLEAAEAFLAEHGCTLEPRGPGPAEPRVIGYASYDLARVIEALPGRAALGNAGPDLWLAAYGAVARWSHPAAGAGAPAEPAGPETVDPEIIGPETIGPEIIGPEIIGPDPAARARLAAVLARPARPVLPPSFGALTADDAAHHTARIERVRDYLAAGDVYQVSLARRLVARIAAPGDPLALYRVLAEVAPAPYGALIEADGLTLVSGSP